VFTTFTSTKMTIVDHNYVVLNVPGATTHRLWDHLTPICSYWCIHV